jgi:radical SAM protein (TIGR01212 family)
MEKYYNKFSDYLLQRYGEKVWKISLDAGFSCPNCDENGREGCIFCRNDSFSLMGSREQKDIVQQIQEGIVAAQKRFNAHKYLAYFQSSTNTFAPINVLEAVFNQAATVQNVIGISISTRPDCLPPAVIDLLDKLTDKVDVWIEVGLQSSHNKTLERINRGHTFGDYLQAIERLKQINVRICTHIMIGLPGETEADVLQTAKRLAVLRTHEVKIHPLLILKGTALETLYQAEKIRALDLNEYAGLAVDFLELLPPEMVIQRLTAEAMRELLIAPQWCNNKLRVLGEIDAEFKRRGSRQGAKFERCALKN